MVRLDPSRKHGSDKYAGPFTITEVKNNGTVKLRKDTQRGASYKTWNIRNIEPYRGA